VSSIAASIGGVCLSEGSEVHAPPRDRCLCQSAQKAADSGATDGSASRRITKKEFRRFRSRAWPLLGFGSEQPSARHRDASRHHRPHYRDHPPARALGRVAGVSRYAVSSAMTALTTRRFRAGHPIDLVGRCGGADHERSHQQTMHAEFLRTTADRTARFTGPARASARSTGERTSAACRRSWSSR
jgi:hypothetical protein